MKSSFNVSVESLQQWNTAKKRKESQPFSLSFFHSIPRSEAHPQKLSAGSESDIYLSNHEILSPTRTLSHTDNEESKIPPKQTQKTKPRAIAAKNSQHHQVGKSNRNTCHQRHHMGSRVERIRRMNNSSESMEIEEEQESIDHLLALKHEVTYEHCLYLIMVTLVFDGIFLYKFDEYSDVSKAIIGLMGGLDMVSMALLARARVIQSKRYWWASFLQQLRFFVKCIFLMQEDSFYLADDQNSLSEMLHFFQAQRAACLLLFFWQSQILIEQSDDYQRYYFFIAFFLQCFLIFHSAVTMVKVDENATDFVRNSIGFTVLLFAGLNYFFSKTIYHLQTLGKKMIRLELQENQKYKYMFNSLTDAIILMQGNSKIQFLNSWAQTLLLNNSDNNPQASATQNPATRKLFYLFQNLKQDEEAVSLQKSEAGTVFSLSELLEMNPGAIVQNIYTTSQELAECTQMDKIQQIISEDSSKPSFFSIKVVQLEESEGHSGELMVQIQDISLRVQSQFMKVERHYLALMNSTVSHEMRNPLNSLLSQVEKQSGLIEKFEAKMKEKDDAEMQEDIKIFRNSLKTSLSSAKLIQFNVEDILAMPQLKAGKFTKSIRHINSKATVEEVVRIMEFKSEAKEVSVSTAYQGFNESYDSVLDPQRFQQVLLNYLSNALKFTNKNDQISILLQKVEPGRIQPLSFLTKPIDDLFKGELPLLSELEEVNGHDQIHRPSRPEELLQTFQSPVHRKESSQSHDRKAFEKEQLKIIKRMLTPSDTPKVVLAIADTGLGIKEDDQTNLFKLYGTIKSTRKVNPKGIGLGLSISKMICEEFKGEVAVLSKWGSGSVFFASFSELEVGTFEGAQGTETELASRLNQIKQTQLTRASVSYKKIQDGESCLNTADGTKNRILIVDDEPYNCEVVKHMIRTFKIPDFDELVISCFSGAEALEALREGCKEGDCSYRLILTDISMPGMDGYELAAAARKLFQSFNISPEAQPTIVSLTGHTESEFMQRALEDMDQVYSKPISSQQVGLILLECGFQLEPSKQLSEELCKK